MLANYPGLQSRVGINGRKIEAMTDELRGIINGTSSLDAGKMGELIEFKRVANLKLDELQGLASADALKIDTILRDINDLKRIVDEQVTSLTDENQRLRNSIQELAHKTETNDRDTKKMIKEKNHRDSLS